MKKDVDVVKSDTVYVQYFENIRSHQQILKNIFIGYFVFCSTIMSVLVYLIKRVEGLRIEFSDFIIDLFTHTLELSADNFNTIGLLLLVALCVGGVGVIILCFMTLMRERIVSGRDILKDISIDSDPNFSFSLHHDFYAIFMAIFNALIFLFIMMIGNSFTHKFTVSFNIFALFERSIFSYRAALLFGFGVQMLFYYMVVLVIIPKWQRYKNKWKLLEDGKVIWGVLFLLGGFSSCYASVANVLIYGNDFTFYDRIEFKIFRMFMIVILLVGGRCFLKNVTCKIQSKFPKFLRKQRHQALKAENN